MPVPCQFHASSSARGHWGAFFASLALCLGVTSLSSQPAKASVQYCNKTGQTIYVAHGHRVKSSSILIEGWHKITNGSCETLNNKLAPKEYNYYHAKFSGGVTLPVFNRLESVYCVRDGGIFSTYHKSSASTETVKDIRAGTNWNACTSLGLNYRKARFRAFFNGYHDHAHYPTAKDTYWHYRHCTVTFTDQGYRDPIRCTGSIRVKAHSGGARGILKTRD